MQEKQPTLKIGQIIDSITGFGGQNTKKVIYKIDTDAWTDEFRYWLINIDKKEYDSCVQKIEDCETSQRKRIGIFYDSQKPEFMESNELEELVQQATNHENQQTQKEEEQRVHLSILRKKGRIAMEGLIPANAKSAIIAEYYQPDPENPEPGIYLLTRKVLLAFSRFRVFKMEELKNAAMHYEPTRKLIEGEHHQYRESIESIGGGGWKIEKLQFYKAEHFIESFAEFAADPENIQLLK